MMKQEEEEDKNNKSSMKYGKKDLTKAPRRGATPSTKDQTK